MANFPTLTAGSSGPDTELLQLALQRAGFDPGSTDGIFGPMTRRAVTDFQRTEFLAPDGAAGPRTWAALEPWILGFRVRTVRPGDTLYRLAQTYGTTLLHIRTANPDADPFRLRPGTRLVIPLGFRLLPVEIRFTSLLLQETVRGLTARYPFLRYSTPGRSVLGTTLPCLTLGSGSRQFFVNAVHHANEWITAPVVLTWLEEACEALIGGGTLSGTDAASLFSAASVSVMPMVDPDGADLVTGRLRDGPAYDRAAAAAANFPAIPFPAGWKANILGTDLNLQYPAGWEEARRIKFAQGFTGPAPRDYVGPEPLSEPESRAVYELTLKSDFRMTLSYHTQGRVIFWRYGAETPENAEAIGRRLSAVSGYRLEDTPPESANAGYRDWFLLRFGRPGYTVEAGLGQNPLPASDLPALLAENIPLLTEALRITAEQA